MINKSKLKTLLRQSLTFLPDREQVNNTQLQQRQLYFHYQTLRASGLPLPHFAETGFRVYSQNDEDGLLLYIFALVGFTDKRCVDIAFGSPFEANTTNLLCNWGFTGLLVEGDPNASEAARKFFVKHPDTYNYPPAILSTWVNAENINELLRQNDVVGQIDLLSLDMDGVDYWVLKAMDAVTPRVIVLEYQDILGPEHSVTVPYRADFTHDAGFIYCGASLSAYINLLRPRGYRLVGCNRYGFNAFFVRQGLAEVALPEVSATECFRHPKVLQGFKERQSLALAREWQEV
jgi:hypothetical protein